MSFTNNQILVNNDVTPQDALEQLHVIGDTHTTDHVRQRRLLITQFDEFPFAVPIVLHTQIHWPEALADNLLSQHLSHLRSLLLNFRRAEGVAA